MSASTLGWALRKNGSCLADVEEDCGATVAPFTVCCPSGSSCPHAYNVACCPSASNCTEALLAKPVCANTTWDLYLNGGYFCCEQGSTGYAKDDGSNGCGSPGYTLQSDEHKIDIISSAPAATSTSTSPSTSTSTSTLATSASSATTTPSSAGTSASSNSHTNTGAIAGGVVGGVAGGAILVALIWFFIHRSRRRKQQLQLQEQSPQVTYAPEAFKPGIPVSELEGSQIAELESTRAQPVAELPAHER